MNRPGFASAEFEDRLRALPGVTAVAATSVLPLSGRGAMIDFAVEGAPPPPPNVNPEIAVASATPDYFRAIGAPLHRGRLFTDAGSHGSAARGASLNEAAVRRWFPDQDPIGKRVISRRAARSRRHRRRRAAAEPGAARRAAMLFLPYAQRTIRSVDRRPRDGRSAGARDRRFATEIRALDPEPAACRHHSADAAGRQVDGPAAFLHQPADAFCRRRAGAVGARASSAS